MCVHVLAIADDAATRTVVQTPFRVSVFVPFR